MRTTTTKPEAPAWYLVDAKGKTLGRLAADIAHVLRGKHKVIWSPHQVHSDHVIVINATGIVLQGNKSDQKIYRRHSGYFGSLKTTPFSRLFAKDPTQVLTRAVKGMVPRNRLRKEALKHLHVFADESHKHEAQKPQDFASLFPKTNGK